MAEDKSLVKNETKEVATNSIPDWMKEDLANLPQDLGLEAISGKDMTLPRLAIAQKTTKQAEEDNPLYLTGLKPGMFFNTLTKEIYGKGPLEVTPLVAKKHRRYFGPREAGSPTLCLSDNGINGGRLSKSCDACDYSRFSYDDKQQLKKPSCTLFWTYIVAIHLPNRKFFPLALSLKSKMLKSAADWNGFMRLRKAPAFTGVYRIEPFLDKAGDNTFYNIKIENMGLLQDEEKYRDGKALFEAINGKLDTIKIHEEDVPEEESADDSEVPF